MWCCIVLIKKEKKVAIVLVLIVEDGKLHLIIIYKIINDKTILNAKLQQN